MERNGDAAAAYLGRIGWSIRQAADRMAIHETRLRRMLRGEQPIPARTMLELRLLADFHAAHPLSRAIDAAEPDIAAESKLARRTRQTK